MTKRFFPTCAIAFSLLGAVACSSDDGDSQPAAPRADLTLKIFDLGELTNNAMYEGWIMVDGEPISTGKFDKLDVGGQKEFSVVEEDLEKATEFILTIEAPGDNDAIPSDTKILQGKFNGDVADVDTGIIADFSDSSGEFIIATPTDEDPDNEEKGIWFLNPNGGNPVAGLKLPTLSKGWKYEGWVVLAEDAPVTTGVFTKVDTRDEDSPFSKDVVAPPNFPGEDFLTGNSKGLNFPADADVRGKKVVISIEPFVDYDSENPFFIKPLVGTAGTETAPTVNTMELSITDLPSGKVTR